MLAAVEVQRKVVESWEEALDTMVANGSVAVEKKAVEGVFAALVKPVAWPYEGLDYELRHLRMPLLPSSCD